LYGTGGFAYGQTEASFSTVGTAASATSTRTGWTAGAGFEIMVAPHWTVRGEYLYVDLGTQSLTGATSSPFFAAPVTFTSTTQFRENVLRAGFNYTFGGPVVARY
jgi:outer membrane immunogenic protein